MVYHKLLTLKKYSNFQELERDISSISNDKEKGDVFEQFIKAYLLLNKQFYQIKEIYLFKEIPLVLKQKLKLETSDYGVDGVILFENEKLATFQVKFRSNRETATYRELATFLGESFNSDYKYIFSNCYELPEIMGKHSNLIT